MYLFFVREFNDIDHITPIVWKMRQDNYPVAVFCLNPEYDLHGDYRLRFLKQQCIKVSFIYDEFGQTLGLWHRIIRLIGKTCFGIVNRLDDHSKFPLFDVFAIIRRYSQKIGKKCYKLSRKKFYNIDVERMLKTFDLLSELKGMEIVIKPHTRSGKEAKVYESILLSNVYEFSSVELCEWADVMLVIGSSILIETLVQRKPVLYLKYLHENTTEYEELGACWTIHDEAELKDAFLSLQINKANVPYAEENINRFLSEIIYGGRGERDVLGDYENFIVSHAANRV